MTGRVTMPSGIASRLLGIFHIIARRHFDYSLDLGDGSENVGSSSLEVGGGMNPE